MVLVGVIWQQTIGNMVTFNIMIGQLRKANEVFNKKMYFANKTSVYNSIQQYLVR